jgi:hypothetical protein
MRFFHIKEIRTGLLEAGISFGEEPGETPTFHIQSAEGYATVRFPLQFAVSPTAFSHLQVVAKALSSEASTIVMNIKNLESGWVIHSEQDAIVRSILLLAKDFNDTTEFTAEFVKAQQSDWFPIKPTLAQKEEVELFLAEYFPQNDRQMPWAVATQPADFLTRGAFWPNGGGASIDIALPLELLRQAAVFERRHRIGYENIYDPRFMVEFGDAELAAETLDFKMTYAALWNARSRWAFGNLRCVVEGGVLFFRCPLASAGYSSRCYKEELEWVRHAVANRFLTPGVNFTTHPIDQLYADFLARAAAEIAKKVLFG